MEKKFHLLIFILLAVMYFSTISITTMINKTKPKENLNEIQLSKEPVLINSWVKFDERKYMLNNNWEEDINFYFLNELFDVDFVYNSYKGKYTNYCLIGSLLSNEFVNKNTIIWGTGIQDDKINSLNEKPKKVLAVRGPLTRKFILDQGIECPEIYGDPATLLPRFYKPEIEKKYEIGIIPHWNSINNETLHQFLENNKNVHLIKTKDYKYWTDIIDEILSCKYIVSESLYGLIISEVYDIPNLWGKINFDNYNLEFHDWFLSIGVDREEPYEIKDNTKVDDLLDELKNYKKGNPIDVDKLLSVCPFKLKNKKDIKFMKDKKFSMEGNLFIEN